MDGRGGSGPRSRAHDSPEAAGLRITMAVGGLRRCDAALPSGVCAVVCLKEGYYPIITIVIKTIQAPYFTYHKSFKTNFIKSATAISSLGDTQ